MNQSLQIAIRFFRVKMEWSRYSASDLICDVNYCDPRKAVFRVK